MAQKIRFITGLGIILYETVFVSVDRPWLLVIAVGLMGYALPKKLDDMFSKEDDTTS